MGAFALRQVLALALLWAASVGLGPSDEPLRGEGRIVSVDGPRGTVSVDHGPLAGLTADSRTEFPVRDPALLARVRVGDRVRFTLVPEQGSHGVLFIATLEVEPTGWREGVAAAWRSGAIPVGLIAALLAGLIAVAWRQGSRLASLARHSRHTQLKVLDEQQAGRRQLEARMEAAARTVEALGDEVGAALRAATARMEMAGRPAGREGGGPRQAAPPLVVVRRGEAETFRLLQERLEQPGLARVVWDRRSGDRRRRRDSVPSDRRRAERRGPASVTWAGLGYAVVEPRGPRLRVVREA